MGAEESSVPTESQKAIATLEWSWRYFYTSITLQKNFLLNTQMRAYLPQQYQIAVAQITTMIAGERIKEIRYPLDWWQAFKERFFPKWLLNWRPVIYHTYKIDLLYPEIEFRRNKGLNVQLAVYDNQKSKGYLEPETDDTED